MGDEIHFGFVKPVAPAIEMTKEQFKLLKRLNNFRPEDCSPAMLLIFDHYGKLVAVEMDEGQFHPVFFQKETPYVYWRTFLSWEEVKKLKEEKLTFTL